MIPAESKQPSPLCSRHLRVAAVDLCSVPILLSTMNLQFSYPVEPRFISTSFGQTGLHSSAFPSFEPRAALMYLGGKLTISMRDTQAFPRLTGQNG